MPADNIPNNVQPSSRLFYGYIIVICSFFITLVVYAVQYTFGVFFVPMSTEFGWTRALTSGAFSLSWLVQGGLSIVMGGLNDRLGPRTVLTICGLLLGASYMLMSQITSVWQFYLLFGVLAGAGLSGVVIPLGSTMARWFVKRRNVMTGLGFLGVSMGVLVGSPISERLIALYDWRIAYVIVGGFAFIVVIVAAQFLKRDPSNKSQPNSQNLVAAQENRPIEQGINLKEAFRIKQFWLLFIIFFGLGYINFTIMVHIVPHALDIGISPPVAAGILSTIGGGCTVGILFLAPLADRIGNIKVYVIGSCMILISIVLLLFASSALSLYIFAIIFSFALGGCCATQSPFIAFLFGLRSHGLLYGMLNLGFSIGATLGSLVTGYLFDVTGAYQIAFIINAALALIGLMLVLVLKPVEKQYTKDSSITI